MATVSLLLNIPCLVWIVQSNFSAAQETGDYPDGFAFVVFCQGTIGIGMMSYLFGIRRYFPVKLFRILIRKEHVIFQKFHINYGQQYMNLVNKALSHF